MVFVRRGVDHVEARRTLTQTGNHIAALGVDRPAHHFPADTPWLSRADSPRLALRLVSNRCLGLRAPSVAFQRGGNDDGYGSLLWRTSSVCSSDNLRTAGGSAFGLPPLGRRIAVSCVITSKTPGMPCMRAVITVPSL